jgi:hypothetical protein
MPVLLTTALACTPKLWHQHSLARSVCMMCGSPHCDAQVPVTASMASRIAAAQVSRALHPPHHPAACLATHTYICWNSSDPGWLLWLTCAQLFDCLFREVVVYES